MNLAVYSESNDILSFRSYCQSRRGLKKLFLRHPVEAKFLLTWIFLNKCKYPLNYSKQSFPHWLENNRWGGGGSSFQYLLKLGLSGPVHNTPFLLVAVFVASKLSVHTTPFLYKNGEKNLCFCAFTLICPITKTQRKTSVFVRSHYSVFVKPIVAYWSVFKNLRFCAFTLIKCVFKNLRFCAFTLIKCVFKNLRFCGYPLLIAFSKTSVFVASLCGSV